MSDEPEVEPVEAWAVVFRNGKLAVGPAGALIYTNRERADEKSGAGERVARVEVRPAPDCPHTSLTSYVGCGGRVLWVCDGCDAVRSKAKDDEGEYLRQITKANA